MSLPVLYSFRRCPYAIRARLALKKSGTKVNLREVVLSDKPDEMLAISPKGTVPVLITSENHVIDESLDIMQWSLKYKDPDDWLEMSEEQQKNCEQLIKYNDGEFKYYLDRYKYADRYPEYAVEEYREEAEVFLAELESRLQHHHFLLGQQIKLADIAILPFIRQFSNVDLTWFEQSKYVKVHYWLNNLLELDLFQAVMKKYTKWQPGDQSVIF